MIEEDDAREAVRLLRISYLAMIRGTMPDLANVRAMDQLLKRYPEICPHCGAAGGQRK